MRSSLFLVLAVLLTTVLTADTQQTHSPPNVSRVTTIWKWCQCGKGVGTLNVWPTHQPHRSVVVNLKELKWIKFQGPVSRISYRCADSKSNHTVYIGVDQNQWFSVLIFNQNKSNDLIEKCNKQTGKISFNIWNTTTFVSSIPFTSHTEGYACFKIPTLLKTSKGTLIAFSEARSPGCDDFDRTDLVYKRSFDNGKTWSQIKVLVPINQSEPHDQGQCGHALVIGNISPIQLKDNAKKYPGRILAPYTRNNFKLWITYSDDDGATWQGNRQIPNLNITEAHPDCNRNMSYFGYNIDQLKLKNLPDFIRYFELICTMKNPYNNPLWLAKLKGPWQFIGVGPSRSLQLKSGRILVPGEYTPIRGLSQIPGTIPISQLYNNFAKGFVLISDDEGDSWRLGKEWPAGQGANQHQMVQLDDGTVLVNSRSLSTGSPQFRVQSVSFTQGQTFSVSEFTEIPQPFAGCQGSTVGGPGGKIFVVSPNPRRGKSILQYAVDALGCKMNLNGRQRLSLWVSRDNGKSYKLDQIIDQGLSAQTSLQYIDGKFYLLYEQADPLPKAISNFLFDQAVRNLRILVPTRFVYRQLQVNHT